MDLSTLLKVQQSFTQCSLNRIILIYVFIYYWWAIGFSINSGINIFDKQWTDKSVGIAVGTVESFHRKLCLWVY